MFCYNILNFLHSYPNSIGSCLEKNRFKILVIKISDLIKSQFGTQFISKTKNATLHRGLSLIAYNV